MFGPLPLLHRVVLVAITLCVGIASGAWVAHFTPLPIAVSAGALIGGLVGVAASYAVVHQQPEPRAVRVGRRR